MGTYVLALYPARQLGTDGENPGRHRVKSGLPGTSAFCPLVFRTPAIEQFMAMKLAERAREVVSRAPRDLLARTQPSFC